MLLIRLNTIPANVPNQHLDSGFQDRTARQSMRDSGCRMTQSMYAGETAVRTGCSRTVQCSFAPIAKGAELCAQRKRVGAATGATSAGSGGTKHSAWMIVRAVVFDTLEECCRDLRARTASSIRGRRPRNPNIARKRRWVRQTHPLSAQCQLTHRVRINDVLLEQQLKYIATRSSGLRPRLRILL